MLKRSATAISCPNIAFIKYWGNCEPAARIPANGSISMNLGGLETRTTVTFDASLTADLLILNGQRVEGAALERASQRVFYHRRQKNLGQPQLGGVGGRFSHAL